MTSLQKELYKAVLEKNYSILKSGALQKRSASSRASSLSNILMELRKVVNHPYIMRAEIQEELDDMEDFEKLVEASAKLALLRRMLKKLKEKGHRVLIFSTMTKMLDMIELFMEKEGYEYERLVSQ